jgi:protein-S-isoprenylcysteine O-methyltransferase Ste14
MVSPAQVMSMLWALWVVSWLIAAFWADRAQARADLATEASYRLVLVLGCVALFLPTVLRNPPLLDWPQPLAWLFVAAGAAGLGFCWWARLHLGRLWSASITRKEDHRIVDSGPYAIVRHPIYTGVLVAGLATALLEARPVAALGLIVVAAGFYQKARLEEGFLRKELGEGPYDAYAARVPMLIPFWRVAGRA